MPEPTIPSNPASSRSTPDFDPEIVIEALDPPPTRTTPPTQLPLQSPLAWRTKHRVEWPELCLAAAMAFWDPLDPEPVTEAVFLAALERAREALRAARVKYPARRPKIHRAVILTHPGRLLHAVIVTRPSGAELQGVIKAAQAEGPEQNVALVDGFVSHLVWPENGSGDFQDTLEMLPAFLLPYGGAIASYPDAYVGLCGFASGEVRRRG